MTKVGTTMCNAQVLVAPTRHPPMIILWIISYWYGENTTTIPTNRYGLDEAENATRRRSIAIVVVGALEFGTLSSSDYYGCGGKDESKKRKNK